MPQVVCEASYQAIGQHGGEVDVRLRRGISRTAHDYRLARGERIGGGYRARDDDVENDIGGKVFPHVIHYPVASRIVLLVHGEENPIQREALIYGNDVLDRPQDLWRRL
jgi:hypothetical protein